jgi:hypothetical protein
MRLAHVMAIAAGLLSIQQCSKKIRSSSGGYSSPVLSADATAVSTLPTRPNGGAVEGKLSTVDPEEAEARRNRNLTQPIDFGKSVAGITMATKYSEAQTILNYYGSAQGRDFYSEHIAIFWGGGADPVPLAIFILEGYGVPLELPPPYGKISPGQSLGSFVSTPEDAKQFLLGAGAGIEKQASGYNCETSLTCQLDETEDAYIFQYRQGGFRISKFAPYTLDFIYFTQPQKFYARSTDPMVYNVGVAGATFQTKRAIFEMRYGPSVPGNGGFEFYDRESVAIQWGPNNTPLSMAANGTYQGTMNFGPTLGNRKIGDSFQAFVTAPNDSPTDLMKVVVRGALNKPDDFDCTVATAPELCTLQLSPDNRFIVILVGRSSFVFTNNVERTFLQYQVSLSAP